MVQFHRPTQPGIFLLSLAVKYWKLALLGLTAFLAYKFMR